MILHTYALKTIHTVHTIKDKTVFPDFLYIFNCLVSGRFPPIRFRRCTYNWLHIKPTSRTWHRPVRPKYNFLTFIYKPKILYYDGWLIYKT